MGIIKFDGEEPLHPRNDPLEDRNEFSGEGNDDDEEVEILDEDVLEVIDLDEEQEVEAESDEEDTIIVPDTDHSSITFSLHGAPVYACEFHPNGRICASGCENEMLYVWDSLTDEVLLEEKFQDSVTLIKFNHDGKYLAVVDMLGNFLCWKHVNNEFRKIKTMKLEKPSWMEWHPLANVLVLSEKIYFCMWKVPSFEVVKYFSLDSYSEAGCLMPDGKNALIGYDEGHAVILDLSSFTVTTKLKYHGMNYEHGIVSVDAHPDNNVVALGTKRGRVMLFTTKKAKVIGIIDIPTSGNSDEYIESIKFGHDTLAGYLLVAFSNFLHIYDQGKLVIRHQIPLSGHAVKLICVEPVAYIATSRAVIDVCDCRIGKKKYSLQGHTKAIMDMTISKNQRRMITGSDDGTVKVFDLDPLDQLLDDSNSESGDDAEHS